MYTDKSAFWQRSLYEGSRLFLYILVPIEARVEIPVFKLNRETSRRARERQYWPLRGGVFLSPL